MYNSTYRVEIADTEPVILRVAPEPDRQFRSERELMRNEHASVPWLSVIAPLMPRVIAADWSHEVIGRDYMVQSLLEGVPAPERLSAYPRETWGGYFRQLGEITAAVHRVRGPHFGSVAGPGHASWSQAVLASLEDIAADVENEGLDPADLRKVAAVAADHRAVLDEVTRPQLLTGDLWTVNVMLSQTASVPRISGVLDFDRTWFGTPPPTGRFGWRPPRTTSGARSGTDTGPWAAPRQGQCCGRKSTRPGTSGRCVWSGSGLATMTRWRALTKRWPRCCPR